jgi:hypothetical protein
MLPSYTAKTARARRTAKRYHSQQRLTAVTGSL